MVKETANQAASIKQRLLNLARREGRIYEVVLVRYALERLLYRLSVSDQHDRFILKGGMLVTLWIEGGNRETRDADFLGYGDANQEKLRATFADIMTIATDDGLLFDTQGLTAATIREEMEYGGVRLRTTAFLERTRIPITIDIGFGDALAAVAQSLAYPSLLGMEAPQIRTYPPAAVVAEKFQAMVALGVVNGRMKDYFDLWAIPKAVHIADTDLDSAIRATFERRHTDIPASRPPGLSTTLLEDMTKQRQWRAYAQSIDHGGLSLVEVVDAVWALVGPSCARIRSSDDKSPS
ncbi:nucleotidyl transferase AbiEii/AbiGii toxin family protein [Rhizobium rhizogenes]|uniref:nucleotidyl transferase AbiEii/AbiGii toxin family protein n=1 Tax=Rhizobium rhizogenes TaxID=359 RepID=UPI001573E6A9|nr:nucleotidyl transferase AbiEii/AbiGii toxin family protein [Rhizobium rhizogenes]NTI33385.1 nucleotidyl transferase AbiEii/AbiGii toxin family protein [Rhizobium rhizogenes]WEO65085.1 nucleotidyl transferase AbiEii/AbiGii toxin family protein [Rhizobium rhizogenes]